MSPTSFTVCAYCPRLCRHVCPVAVATAREAATPTAMMTVPLLDARGDLGPADALAGTSLCLGCGACTAHCKVHVPVAERLTAWRAARLPSPAAAPLEAIEGSAQTVCVLVESDWSQGWSARIGQPVATVRTADELGHAAWTLGAEDVPAQVAAHFAGRTLVTASAAVQAVARAAGLPVVRVPAPAGNLAFVTCHDGPLSSPDQLACCGRRGGFVAREPEAARAVAEESVRLLAGREAVCGDEGCASWLREHGARIDGPTDTLCAAREANVR